MVGDPIYQGFGKRRVRRDIHQKLLLTPNERSSDVGTSGLSEDAELPLVTLEEPGRILKCGPPLQVPREKLSIAKDQRAHDGQGRK